MAATRSNVVAPNAAPSFAEALCFGRIQRLLHASFCRNALKTLHRLAALEDQDRWNCFDTVFERRLLIVVDVHLADLCRAHVLGRQFVDHRSNFPARAAPRRPKIDQYRLIAAEHLRIECAIRNFYYVLTSHVCAPLRYSPCFNSREIRAADW